MRHDGAVYSVTVGWGGGDGWAAALAVPAAVAAVRLPPTQTVDFTAMH